MKKKIDEIDNAFGSESEDNIFLPDRSYQRCKGYFDNSLLPRNSFESSFKSPSNQNQLHYTQNKIIQSERLSMNYSLINE